MKRTPMKRSAPLRMAGPAYARVDVLKIKKCPVKKGGCGQPFRQSRPGQMVCGNDCAQSHTEWLKGKTAEENAKAGRKQDRAKLQALRPLSYFADKAQREVNRYVRLKERGNPCISCGNPWQENYQAGHYLSRGARPELRYHLGNLHIQCIPCNHHKSGNASMYRVNLVSLIGAQRVESLEGPRTLPKWARDDYQRIEKEFKALADELAGRVEMLAI
jgi:hypothetical protein